MKFKKIKEKYINKEEDEKIEDLTPKKQLSFEKDSASDDNNDTDDTDTKSKSQRKLPKIKLPSFNFGFARTFLQQIFGSLHIDHPARHSYEPLSIIIPISS